MKLFSFIPHMHRWKNITITRGGAISPSGRSYYSTHISAQCKGCDVQINKVYYRDISDAEARRWLG
ncbi:hypothetical protein [Pantoea sp.]|uniref:hypothetical protein n=1 Tax=Pantoea sp. TaxID=69393 RepID=UPI0031CE76EE